MCVYINTVHTGVIQSITMYDITMNLACRAVQDMGRVATTKLRNVFNPRG